MTSSPDTDLTSTLAALDAAMSGYTMPAAQAAAATDELIATAEDLPWSADGVRASEPAVSLSAQGVSGSEAAQDLRALVERLQPPRKAAEGE